MDEEAEDTPGAQEFPEAEPQGAMGGATSYAGTTSYAGDEVSVSELNAIRVAAGLEPIMDDVEDHPHEPAVNPYRDEVPLDGENTGTGGAGKPNKHYEPPHDPMYEDDEDCPTYEDQVVELMRLAGIDCDKRLCVRRAQIRARSTALQRRQRWLWYGRQREPRRA